MAGFDVIGDTDQGTNTHNNIIWFQHPHALFPAVIYDEWDPDPNRRYKMAYESYPDGPSYWGTQLDDWTRLLTSPDGKQWTPIVERVPLKYMNEISSFYRFKGRYFLSGQQYNMTAPLPPGGMRPRRVMSVWSTHDFDYWPVERSLAFYKPLQFSADGSPRQWDGEQIHMAAGIWPRGNVCLGIYGQLHSGDYMNKSQLREPVEGSTIDLGFIISNDGLHFREPAPGSTLVRNQNFGGDLLQANAFVNMGDLTYIWIGGNGVSLMTLRRDGFAYLEVPTSIGASDGSFLTENMIADSTFTLHINVDDVSVENSLELELVEEVQDGYLITPLDPIESPGVFIQVTQNKKQILIPPNRFFRIRGYMVPGQKFFALYGNLQGSIGREPQGFLWETY